MQEVKEFCLILLAISVLCLFVIFSCGAFIDYWNGTARASLIKKQTGIEYTWREASQIHNIYDRNNIRIELDRSDLESK